MAARLDPLGSDPIGDPALDPAYHGLGDDALERIPAAALDLFVPGETLADSLPRLRETYAGPIAYQIEHLSGHRQRLWLREAIESGAYTQPLPPDERRHILDRLLRVETFEHYLHRAFLGEKQFSIEGLDVMVLMLDEMIMLAAQAGIAEAVVGMAHRGRLNVLAHVLRRNYTSIMAEFEGRPGDDVIESLPVGGAGDVKYHHGARSSRAIDVVVREGGEVRVEQRRIDISLLPNPSHLEFVNPVVAGRVRALQTDQERSRLARRHEPRARHHDPRRRGVPRPGRRRGDAQPAVAGRLPRRRHAARDREQPGRLHDGRRTTRARRATRPTSPRASTSRSSTSTPTPSTPAAARCAWRWPSASASGATC